MHLFYFHQLPPHWPSPIILQNNSTFGRANDLVRMSAGWSVVGTKMGAMICLWTTSLSHRFIPSFDEQTIDQPQKFFCQKVDWTNEKKKKKKKKNCGVLKALNVDDNSGLGPCHYLVQQDGSVASGDDQEMMHNEACAAWTTMKIYGHWDNIDEDEHIWPDFFYCHMHACFSEFQYCAHDWKACQFATTYFPAWSGKLEEDPGIKTESVKVKSTLDIKTESGSMAWTNSAKSKHPPSLTIFTFGIQPKKKRVDIDNPHLAIQQITSLPSSLMAGKNCAIQIINTVSLEQSTVESNASLTNSNVTHSVPEVAPTLATIFCLIPPSSREPCIIIEDLHNWTDHPHFC
ncbi:hypothetical protein EDB19DRAFT_1915568 [Suillus lakei]|nr:hypothetical protein EDB19DRAFT_1915568 [Suillus lakei]